MTNLWNENIASYRANMAAAQARARKLLEIHGVKFFDPSPQEIVELRKRMMAEQDQLAKDIKLSPDLVKVVTANVGDAS
jgi:hypothetical protein